jgi:signal transduction histidine kinase
MEERRIIDRETGSSGPDLAARLRRIDIFAGVAAAIWIAASALGALALSHEILARAEAEAGVLAVDNNKEIAQIAGRMFTELQAIAEVLATDRSIFNAVRRYNSLEPAFGQMPQDQLRVGLAKDSEVARISSRLTQLRDRLRYDLVYVIDAQGIRLMSADWDRDPTMLGLKLSDREYFQDSMAGRTGQQFAISRTTRKPDLFFSAPIMDVETPIGVVVVRQTTDVVGKLLSVGQQVALVVDRAGMVVATSYPAFYMRHMEAADRAFLRGYTDVNDAPDADTLRKVYGQESLRPLTMLRSGTSHWFGQPVHASERVIDGHRYLVTSDPLTEYPEYSLFVFSPIDWVDDLRRLHLVIGALVSLVGALIIVFIGRRMANLARRAHDAQLLVALNEKLTAANVEKNRYLGIAAHDLRNPLSSIRGLSQLLMEDAVDPPEQREFHTTINRTSDEMLGLVNDLLDVAVIESGKLDLRLKEVDVATLVRQRVHQLEPLARNKKISLDVDADGAQHANIDPARFSQVIDNLVSNAIKFSPLESRVQVVLRQAGNGLTFSVQDQGPGIPESERKLLFRSFQKLSARPTGGEKSTGLGLAIVKRIVDAHGGTIEVESTPGKGTRFSVAVPFGPTA